MSANKRNPPPDTPVEAEFRTFAREWADYILAPERIDDDALDRAIAAGADTSQFRSALRLAALRRLGATRRKGVRNRVGGRFAGHHVHYRDKYIIGLIAAAHAAGIKRRKARRIVGDVFKLDKPTIRRIDRSRIGEK